MLSRNTYVDLKRLDLYMYRYRYRSVEECTMKRKETSEAKLFDFKVGCETELGRSVPPGTVHVHVDSRTND